MSESLYLDTARLGLISPSAQRLQIAFARFASDPQSLLYFGEFLRHGLKGLPDQLQTRFGQLREWQGIDGLSQSIQRQTVAPAGSETLLASRSVSLMRLAAECTASRCRRVVTTDLLWSPYRRALAEACRRRGRALVVCRLRRAALEEAANANELAHRLVSSYQSCGGDGLVLPFIDHRGIGLPLNRVVAQIASEGCRPKSLVVDGSQAVGQVPVDLETMGCDHFIAGAHKWVGGYHPLGIAVVQAEAAASILSRILRSDPILRLTQEATGRVAARHGETAAILPLLTAAGAFRDLDSNRVESRLAIRLANRAFLTEAIKTTTRWRPVIRDEPENAVLLVRPPIGFLARTGFEASRSLAAFGIAATSYRNHSIRLSMPSSRITQGDRRKLRTALSACLGSAAKIAQPCLPPRREGRGRPAEALAYRRRRHPGLPQEQPHGGVRRIEPAIEGNT